MQVEGPNPEAQPQALPPAPPDRKRRWLSAAAWLALVVVFSVVFGGNPQVYFVVLVVAVLPVLAAYSAWQIRKGQPYPPKKALFANIIFLQAGMTVVAFVAARDAGLALFRDIQLSAAGVAAAGAMLLLMLGVGVRGFSKADLATRERLERFLPASRRELAGWFAVSLAAGIAEEIIYRGVLIALLWGITGSFAAALALSVAAFAAAHAYQGMKAVITIAVFGLGFHLLVMGTGTLVLAMAVHFLYDFLFGAYAMRRLAAPPMPGAAPAPAAEA